MSLEIVIIGLSLSSSWGNGHATTYRSLIRGLDARGHRVLFLERDVPWYAENRDLPDPDFCAFATYQSVAELAERFGAAIRRADAVIVGSYVPEGVTVIDRVRELHPRRLCFYDIDTPVTVAALARGEEAYLARRQVPAFDVYFSFSGGPILRGLEREFGAQRALPLYCSVDVAAHAPRQVTPKWDFGYLGTYSGDRQPALNELLLEPARRLPERRFVVAGPMYPDDIDWPANVERISHLPPAEHAAFYGSQRFTLNVTRADMIAAGYSPSVRLFEAAAAGTPLLSDDWPGLTELLPTPDSIGIVSRAADVVRILTGMPEADRLGMARRAQRIVMREHTGFARAGELVAALQAVPQRVEMDA